MDKKQLIKELRKFKKKIEKRHRIKKIILFGSRAKDIKPKKEADVDLILVGDFKEKTNLKRSPDLYLDWSINLPVDFLCYTPKEFEALSKKVTIVREALEKGIVIE